MNADFSFTGSINPFKLCSVHSLSAIALLFISGCTPPSSTSVTQTAQPKKSNPCVNVASEAKYPFAHVQCSLANSAKTVKNLKLYWWNPDLEKPFYTFNHLKDYLSKRQKTLKFAVNAGMYDKQFAPLALYIENKQQLKKLNLKQGKGNFHLLPNGVFWIDSNNVAHVIESKAFSKLNDKTAKEIKYATQSGPMLVIEGNIHPKFQADSTSKKIRNGLGICKPNIQSNQSSVIFITSNEPINFYNFAKLFKDKLKCNNALFLDGGIASAVYSSGLNRNDEKYMGPMLGYTE